jgi:D-alanine-D-alanine ligase
LINRSSVHARAIVHKKDLFVVCAVDADVVGQLPSGRRRWYRARWDGSVIDSLRKLYTRVEFVGVEVGCLDGPAALVRLRPDLVFNLSLSATPAEAAFAACLEFAGIRYTGSGSLGIALANDKIRSRQLLAAAGVRVPRFVVLAPGASQEPVDLTPPVIVKPAFEGISFGVALDSVVMTRKEAVDRARKIWKRFEEPAVCDEFIQGREFRVGLIEGADGRFEIAGICEWSYPEAERGFKTEKKRRNVRLRALGVSQIPRALSAQITAVARTALPKLGLRGYASMDLRLDQFDRVTVLEVNANPGVSSDSPTWNRPSFDRNVQRIVEAALRPRSAWQ